MTNSDFNSLGVNSKMRHLAGNSAQGRNSKQSRVKAETTNYFGSVAGEFKYEKLKDISLGELQQIAGQAKRELGEDNYRSLCQNLRILCESTTLNESFDMMNGIYSSNISGDHIINADSGKKLIYIVFMSKVEEIRHESFLLKWLCGKNHNNLKAKLIELFKPEIVTVVEDIVRRVDEADDLQREIDEREPFLALSERFGYAYQAYERANGQVIRPLPPSYTTGIEEQPVSGNEYSGSLPDYSAITSQLSDTNNSVTLGIDRLGEIVTLLSKTLAVPENLQATVLSADIETRAQELARYINSNLQSISFVNLDKIRNEYFLQIDSRRLSGVKTRIDIYNKAIAVLGYPEDKRLNYDEINLDGLDQAMTKLKSDIHSKDIYDKLTWGQVSELNLLLKMEFAVDISKFKEKEEQVNALLNVFTIDDSINLPKKYAKREDLVGSFMAVSLSFVALKCMFSSVSLSNNSTTIGMLDIEIKRMKDKYQEALPQLIDFVQILYMNKPLSSWNDHDRREYDVSVSQLIDVIARITSAIKLPVGDIMVLLSGNSKLRVDENFAGTKLDKLKEIQLGNLKNCQVRLQAEFEREVEPAIAQLKNVQVIINDMLPKLNDVNAGEISSWNEELELIQSALFNFYANTNNTKEEFLIKDINRKLSKLLDEVHKINKVDGVGGVIKVKYVNSVPNPSDFMEFDVLVHNGIGYSTNGTTNAIIKFDLRSMCERHSLNPADILGNDVSKLKALLNSASFKVSFAERGLVIKDQMTFGNLYNILSNISTVILKEITAINQQVTSFDKISAIYNDLSAVLENSSVNLELNFNFYKLDELLDEINESSSIRESVFELKSSYFNYKILLDLHRTQVNEIQRLKNSIEEVDNENNLDARIKDTLNRFGDIALRGEFVNSLESIQNEDALTRRLVSYTGNATDRKLIEGYTKNYNATIANIKSSLDKTRHELLAPIDDINANRIIGTFSKITDQFVLQCGNFGIDLSKYTPYHIREHVKNNNGGLNSIHMLKSLAGCFILADKISAVQHNICQEVISSLHQITGKRNRGASTRILFKVASPLIRERKASSIKLYTDQHEKNIVDHSATTLPGYIDIDPLNIKLKEIKNRLNESTGHEPSAQNESKINSQAQHFMSFDQNLVMRELLFLMSLASPEKYRTKIEQLLPADKLKDMGMYLDKHPLVILKEWINLTNHFIDKYRSVVTTNAGLNLTADESKTYWIMSHKLFNYIMIYRIFLALDGEETKRVTNLNLFKMSSSEFSSKNPKLDGIYEVTDNILFGKSYYQIIGSHQRKIMPNKNFSSLNYSTGGSYSYTALSNVFTQITNKTEIEIKLESTLLEDCLLSTNYDGGIKKGLANAGRATIGLYKGQNGLKEFWHIYLALFGGNVELLKIDVDKIYKSLEDVDERRSNSITSKMIGQTPLKLRDEYNDLNLIFSCVDASKQQMFAANLPEIQIRDRTN